LKYVHENSASSAA